jgi:hypothetical protein
MTVEQLIQQLRHLVLEYPLAAQQQVALLPHGHQGVQSLEQVHFGNGVNVLLEARR